MENKKVNIKCFQEAMRLLSHVGFGYTTIPLPIEDLIIFRNINDILGCLTNEVWGFELEKTSSLNGKGKYHLSKQTKQGVVFCSIETDTTSIELEFYTSNKLKQKVQNIFLQSGIKIHSVSVENGCAWGNHPAHPYAVTIDIYYDSDLVDWWYIEDYERAIKIAKEYKDKNNEIK